MSTGPEQRLKNELSIVSKFTTQFENTFKSEEHTKLIDLKAGYSLQAYYNKGAVKRLRIAEGRTYRPYFVFYLHQDKDSGLLIDGDYVALSVRVDCSLEVQSDTDQTIKYRSEDQYMKSKINKPINIISNDVYFYNFSKDKFFKKEADSYKEVSLRDIYDRLFKQHLAEYTNLTGLLIRVRILSLRTVPIFFIGIIYSFLSYAHWFNNGLRYKFDPIMESFVDRSEPTQLAANVPDPKNEIDFFGYKVRLWTIVSYSILSILVYVIAVGNVDKDSLIYGFFSSSFLIILYAVVSIVMWDRALPKILKVCIKGLGSSRASLEWKGIKLG